MTTACCPEPETWNSEMEHPPCPVIARRGGWLFGAVILLAGYLLFCHGCHGDEDNELFIRATRSVVESRHWHRHRLDEEIGIRGFGAHLAGGLLPFHKMFVVQAVKAADADNAAVARVQHVHF